MFKFQLKPPFDTPDLPHHPTATHSTAGAPGGAGSEAEEEGASRGSSSAAPPPSSQMGAGGGLRSTTELNSHTQAQSN